MKLAGKRRGRAAPAALFPRFSTRCTREVQVKRINALTIAGTDPAAAPVSRPI
jgi:hypothetical protein